MADPTAHELIEVCRSQYLDGGGSPETWRGDYAKVLKHLPQNEPVTPHALSTLLKNWPPNTRSRHRAAHAAKYLARFAQITWEPGELKGRYKAVRVDASKLPTDGQVQQLFFTIRNPYWRSFYGVMAAYGTRPHEALRLDYGQFLKTDGRILVPENTKTGSRVVFPLYPEWFDLFELREAARPKVSLTRTNSQLGHSATEYFSDTVKLPFNLYALRHLYAYRLYQFGYPDSVAALMMGHSEQVHNTIYRGWFSELELARTYNALKESPNRPQPPTL